MVFLVAVLHGCQCCWHGAVWNVRIWTTSFCVVCIRHTLWMLTAQLCRNPNRNAALQKLMTQVLGEHFLLAIALVLLCITSLSSHLCAGLVDLAVGVT